ncbi:MAG: hypothetical protein QF360_04735, partial [Phycisphaerales bacterium]|nr:hypothetical protein [Phycisphaerales bacterium]
IELAHRTQLIGKLGIDLSGNIQVLVDKGGSIHRRAGSALLGISLQRATRMKDQCSHDHEPNPAESERVP